MDYKYIEQLIERYFNCETSLQEEQILRSFFRQDDVPVHLSMYTDIFSYEESQSDISLSEDFDKKMMELIEMEGDNTSEARNTKVVRLRGRFAPLFKAAAIVAIILTIGNAAEQAMADKTATDVEDVTAINPYIKQENISAAIKIKNNTQAETKPVVTDSILIDKND